MIRSFFLSLLSIGVAYLTLELFSLGLYYSLSGESYSMAALESRRNDIREGYNTPEEESHFNDLGTPYMTIHPYMGYVYSPVMNSKNKLITEYGLPGEINPIAASRDPQIALIAIAGGSVAERFFMNSRDLLRSYLQKLPMFKGRQVKMIMLGREFYNQPQSLISVLYYLIQGGRLDMLINIDGYNEVRNGYVNYMHGVYPALPHISAWSSLFKGNLTPKGQQQLTEIMMWKRLRHAGAQLGEKLRYSITGSTIWYMADRHMQQHLATAAMEMSTADNNPYYLRGPNVMNETKPDEVIDFIASVWERSSAQLYELSQKHRFSYFHFIHPNQYIPDSKPLSAQEREHFYNPDSENSMGVARGYPALRARAEHLRAGNVNVYDLSLLFKERSETMYLDSCCHLSALGNEVMARAIGEQINQFYKAN